MRKLIFNSVLISPIRAMRLAVILLAWEIIGLAGCGIDSHTGDAQRAAESAEILTANAAKDCPWAVKEIAAADAAGNGAEKAGAALDAAGKELDTADKRMAASSRNADRANERQVERQRDANAAQKEYEAADAAYLAANEEYETAVVQSAAELVPPKLSGKVARAKAKRDKLKKQHDENMVRYGNRAIALKKKVDDERWLALKIEKERDAFKTARDTAKANYDAKRDDALAKTKESKAANAKLLEVCPKARRGLETPDSTRKGLDVFNKTKDHHQEPGH